MRVEERAEVQTYCASDKSNNERVYLGLWVLDAGESGTAGAKLRYVSILGGMTMSLPVGVVVWTPRPGRMMQQVIMLLGEK